MGTPSVGEFEFNGEEGGSFIETKFFGGVVGPVRNIRNTQKFDGVGILTEDGWRILGMLLRIR